LCEGVLTVDGAISESDGSTDLTEETADVVESDEEIQDESGSSITLSGRIRMLTTYTSNLEFTSTGAETVTLGTDAGVETDPDYDETDDETTGSALMKISFILISLYYLVAYWWTFNLICLIIKILR